MEIFTSHWTWIIAGILLMLMELIAPGFILCFFGLASIIVGLITFCVPSGIPFTLQLVLFTVLSVGCIFALRRSLKNVFTGETSKSTGSFESQYVGRIGEIVETVRPEVPGRVRVGDAEWNATAATRIEKGAEVRVVKQENLTFTVEPIA